MKKISIWEWITYIGLYFIALKFYSRMTGFFRFIDQGLLTKIHWLVGLGLAFYFIKIINESKGYIERFGTLVVVTLIPWMVKFVLGYML